MLFILGVVIWVLGIWILSGRMENVDATQDFNPLFWLDVATFVPFTLGFVLGVQSLLKREPSATLGVAGFALNGILMFKFLFGLVGLY